MIFTAQPVPRNQTSSQEFRDYGARELAPCPVTDSRISLTANDTANELSASVGLTMLPGYAHALASKGDITDPSKGFFDTYKFAASEANFLFDIPLMAVKVPNTEQVSAKMKEYGMVQTTQGRYTFWQGPSDGDLIGKINKLKGEMYSYAPAERVSMGGAVVAHQMRRLLYHILRAAPVIQASAACVTDEIVYANIRGTGRVKKTAGCNLLDTNFGHFFPYFDGLVVPDRSIIHTLIRLCHRLLGSTQATRTTNTLAWLRGWNSIHTTSMGKTISHIAMVLDIALNAGAQPFIQYSNGEYIGMVLLTSAPVVFQSTKIAAKKGTEINAEVESMHSHAKALQDICDILSPLPHKSGSPVIADPNLLETARMLHYACRNRTVDLTNQAAIRAIIPRLRFQQKFWKVRENSSLLPFITALETKEVLPMEAPFDLSTDALFSKSVLFSTLAAFGPVGPSPMMQTNANVSMTVREGFLTKGAQGALKGIPIFPAPIQQAAEAWKLLRKTGNVSYRSKGKDAQGYLRLSGKPHLVTDAAFGRDFKNLFISYAAKGVAKKRKEREEDDETGKSTAKLVSESTAKRARIEQEGDELLDVMDW